MATTDANIWVAIVDATDVFHAQSVAFLSKATRRHIPLHVPTFVFPEVACVLARRFRDPSAGLRAVTAIRANALLRVVEVDDSLIALATELGTRQFLRGADALYAATAQVTGSTLVSWDNELIQRSGALSPSGWLDAN